MADNTNVLTETALEAQMDDENLNPDVKSTTTSTSTNRKIIHITLVVDGVDIDYGELYDSLATVKADVSAVTRVVAVTGEKNVSTRDTHIFNIGPT